MPLKRGVPRILEVSFGINPDTWSTRYDTPTSKDSPFPELLGATPRQLQIALSENYFKPIWGKEVFGRMLATRLQRLPISGGGKRIVVVSDSGFRSEAEPLVSEFGSENTFLVRLYRPGCTFDGDSRGYIKLSDLGVREIEFENTAGKHVLSRFGQEILRVLSIPPESKVESGDAYNPGHIVREPEQDYQRRISEAWGAILSPDKLAQWVEEENELAKNTTVQA